MQYFGMPFWGAQAPLMMPPIVKTYQVSTDGPGANHSKLALIYEDALPIKPFVSSSSTLGERLNMYQFIRSSILSNVDGKDISMNTMIEAGGAPSLLSFIKFGDLNPYNTYKLSNNLYKGLPEGYLIYRSCYPIRQDLGSTTCSKDATTINVKIYKMLEGSFNVNRTNPDNFYNYDEWREVAFYEYIRENILKKKISPHFPAIYGYFISEKCGIDFDAIELAKDNTDTKKQKQPLYVPSTNNTLCNKSLNLGPNPNPLNTYIPMKDLSNNGTLLLASPQNSTMLVGNYLTSGIPQTSQDFDLIKKLNTPSIYKQTRPEDYINTTTVKRGMTLPSKYISDINTLAPVQNNPDLYAGKTLVILTESPTFNLISWATRTYEQRQNVRVMVNRGVHTYNEWINIIFQIMAALYTMQLYGIYIKNFKLENNILIKDLSVRGAITNYWKYKINGIDYYLPNLGYLIMIDSNFKDLVNNSALLHESTFNKKNITNTGKVGGKFIVKEDPNIINDNVFDMFIESFNVNTFDKDFDQSGGCKPPPEIMDIIGKIYGEASTDTTKDISVYITKYMTHFLHNRVGTYVRELEKPNIRPDDTRLFTKGQLIVHEEGFGTYKFVLFMSVNNGVCNILTKNDPMNEDIIEITTPITSLYNYSKSEPITQIFKPNEANMNEEDLLETYILK